MRVLFIGNNYPPEVNALATRLYEHAQQWVQDGVDVTVVTDVPNFPEGKVYAGYQNRFSREDEAGVDLVRVPLYITPNAGTLKRILSFISFMFSVMWFSRRVEEQPDVVVASSPQFFAAIAGYFVSRKKKAPFVLEIRDLWPESIVAVGAMKRNAIIRFFERIEQFLYEKADHIVVVTEAFKTYIVERGIDEEKLSVLKNGADLKTFEEPLDELKLAELRTKFDLSGKFVVSYIGTIGMAHRVDVMLEAAKRCQHPDVTFLVVGTGAQRAALEAQSKAYGGDNFVLVEKQPKELARYFLALSDVSLVHLKDSPLFRTVIPSKLFEAMAMQTPILLGVEGESRALVEEAGAGLAFPPENVDALLDGIDQLYRNPTRYNQLASSGYRFVKAHHNRPELARRYAGLLSQVARVPLPVDSLVLQE